MTKIGIIRESRKDDNRTPLIPIHIKKITNEYPNIEIIVQPSKHRCFKDEEYKKQGAILSEDLSECDLILGIKEIATEILIQSKKYIFFSHTSKIKSDNSATAQGTPGMDKKELLKEILKKKITLIDYENIRDNLKKRYLGFGRFAGIVGCYNSLNLYLETIGEKNMQRAYSLDSYDKIKKNVKDINFKNAKIIVTGDGRVAKGVIEFLSFSNIKEVSINHFNKYNNDNSIFCNLTTADYVNHKNGLNFNLQHFINHPSEYISKLEQYLPYATMLISAHYWDPKSPVLFKKENFQNLKNLKVIGDITCDVNGSIPTTFKSTTITNPYYYINKKTLEETKKLNDSLAIMAVDNLPSELPKDSSEEFGDAIVKEIIPYIIGKDDGRIKKATIIENGYFCSSYRYLNDYINS